MELSRCFGKLKAVGALIKGNLSCSSVFLTVYCWLDSIFFYWHIPTDLFSSEDFFNSMLPCWKNTRQPLAEM